MTQPDNTVFISYRRQVTQYLALTIREKLRARGYTVFWDQASIGAGLWSETILRGIESHWHFIVLLTHGTLDRCNEPGDWLRREIEHALKTGRNIIPLMVDCFSFRDAEKHLTGELSKLPNYQAVNFYIDYVDAGLEKLCRDFLICPQPKGVIAPLAPAPAPMPATEVLAGLPQIATAREISTPKTLEIDYLDSLRHAEPTIDLDESARETKEIPAVQKTETPIVAPQYSVQRPPEAPRPAPPTAAPVGDARATGEMAAAEKEAEEAPVAAAEPEAPVAAIPEAVMTERLLMAEQFFIHAFDRQQRGDLNGAIANYTRAIRLNPRLIEAYYNRGLASVDEGELGRAITDYNQVVALNPQYTEAYNNRGVAYFQRQDYAQAQADFQQALNLCPGDAMALGGLAATLHALGQIDAAKRLWRQLLEKDARYRDLAWVKQEFNWRDSLVEEARQLLAKLG